jgi:hypothetical protein
MDEDEVLPLEDLLEKSLRAFERRHFPGIPPVERLEIVKGLNNPGCYQPDRKVIQLDSSIVRFMRLTQVVILHELVNHKLCCTDPNYKRQPYTPQFDAELARLWAEGAYQKRL